jgi:hypothetical protein
LPWIEKIPDGNTSEDNIWLFKTVHVVPLTVTQNTPEWFLMRIFSCTSSASDNLPAEVKNMLLTPEPCPLRENEENAFQSTLDMVYGDGWDRDKVAPSPTLLQEVSAPNQEQAMDDTTLILNDSEEGLEMNLLLLMSSESVNVGLKE